jgi:hypothetical protein
MKQEPVVVAFITPSLNLDSLRKTDKNFWVADPRLQVHAMQATVRWVLMMMMMMMMMMICVSTV